MQSLIAVTTTTTMPPKVVEGTTSSVGSRQTTVDLDQPGQVNEDNTPFVGEVGGLTNKAITTTITGLSSLALLMTSIVLALSCV